MNDMIDHPLDLEPLDPESREAGYWVRFHHQVMASARPELARRRAAETLSVPEVVFQWRKTLVPVSLLAAALAGIVLMNHQEQRIQFSPVAVEDALVEGLPGDPIPTVLGRDADLDEVAFLAAAGGFRP